MLLEQFVHCALAEFKELGLDDSYRRYIGTNAYSIDAGFRDQQFQDKFVRTASYA